MVGTHSDQELVKYFSKIVDGDVDVLFVRRFRREMRRRKEELKMKCFKEMLIEYFEANL